MDRGGALAVVSTVGDRLALTPNAAALLEQSSLV
jgi:hypothetical protein